MGRELPGDKITALHVAGGRLWAGVWERGVFTSADGGATWVSISSGLPDLHVRAIASTRAGLVVATDGGIFRRDPRALRWRRALGEGQMVSLNRVSATELVSGGVRGTARSTDGGRTWRWIHEAGAAHHTTVLGSTIVIMNVSGDLFVSDDRGRAWRPSPYEPRAGSYVYDVVAAGKTWIASNNYGIHVSTDRGRSWRLAYPNERSVFFDLEAVGGVVYAGSRTWNERRERSAP